jgi:hypothetical protein
VTVKPGAVLQLSGGLYRFRSLELEPGAQLVLDTTSETIRAYILDHLTYRGEFVHVGGSAADVLFAVAGDQVVAVEAPWPGATLVAPNADIHLSSSFPAVFRGAFFGRRGELFEGGHVIWDPYRVFADMDDARNSAAGQPDPPPPNWTGGRIADADGFPEPLEGCGENQVQLEWNVCVDAIREGDPCDPDHPDAGLCDVGLSCIDRTCQQGRGVGDECNPDTATCATQPVGELPLHCLRVDVDEYRCHPYHGVGDHAYPRDWPYICPPYCPGTIPCAPGLVLRYGFCQIPCTDENDDAGCATMPGGGGGTCISGQDVGDWFCDSCKDTVGSWCSEDPGGGCCEGLVCDIRPGFSSGTCRRPLEGTMCRSDGDCAAATADFLPPICRVYEDDPLASQCIDGRPEDFVGDLCETDRDCLLGWCYNGSCRLTVTGMAGDMTADYFQSEAVYNASEVADDQGMKLVETILFNDDSPRRTPPEIQHPDDDLSLVFPGAAVFGWATRVTRDTDTQTGDWVHHKIETPAGWSLLWADPRITSAPDAPELVLGTILAASADSFSNAVDDSLAGWATVYPDDLAPCTDCILRAYCGPTCTDIPGIANALSGLCVLSSVDGGEHFELPSSQCYTYANHQYDGTEVVIGRGVTPRAYFAAWNYDASPQRLELWKTDNAWDASTFTRVAGHGIDCEDGDLQGDCGINQHPRLRMDADDRLWVMMRHPRLDLAVNVVTPDGTWQAPRALLAEGRELAWRSWMLSDFMSLRVAAPFSFDIGVNLRGEPEMRYAYTYYAAASGRRHIQVGRCDYQLTDCSEPGWWSTEILTGEYPEANHAFPSLRYAETALGPTWMLTWLSTAGSDGTRVAVWASRVQEVLFPEDPFPARRYTPLQTPCPLYTGYWGDYDEMGYNPWTDSFVRPFTDSSRGCLQQSRFRSRHHHVSAVSVAPW